MKRFGISNSTRCSITYKTSNDYVILEDKELFDAIYNLIGKSKEFTVGNYYGAKNQVKFTITGVEERFAENGNSLGYSLIVDSYDNTPEAYYPTPFEIVKGMGLLCPISYSI